MSSVTHMVVTSYFDRIRNSRRIFFFYISTNRCVCIRSNEILVRRRFFLRTALLSFYHNRCPVDFTCRPVDVVKSISHHANESLVLTPFIHRLKWWEPRFEDEGGWERTVGKRHRCLKSGTYF